MQYRTAFQVSAIKNRYHPPISSNVICTCLKGLTMATGFPTDTGRGTSRLWAYPVIYWAQHKSKIWNECLISWLMNEIRRAAHPKQMDKRICQSAAFSPNPSHLTRSKRLITTEMKSIFQNKPPVTRPQHSTQTRHFSSQKIAWRPPWKKVMSKLSWRPRSGKDWSELLGTQPSNNMWCNSLK